MASLVATIGMSLLKALVTEAFIKKVILAGLKRVAKSSKNTLDDEVVEAVAENIGVKITVKITD